MELKSWLSSKVKKPWSYFIVCEKFVKIGSAKDPQKRMASLQTGCPFQLHLYGVSDRNEYWLHDKFSSLKVRNEWFWWDCGTIKKWLHHEWQEKYGNNTLLEECSIEHLGISKTYLRRMVDVNGSAITIGKCKLAIDEHTNNPAGVRIFGFQDSWVNA